MAKVELAKEIIEAHTTEEIVAWVNESLRGIDRVVSSAPDQNNAIVLNYANLKIVMSVVNELDTKLNGKKSGTVL